METNFIQKQKTRAFTLIELMITVAIVAIISVVAVPFYQDYVIKSEVSEGFGLSDSIRVAEADYYYNMGTFPTSLSTLGLSSPTGKYITSISLGDNGVITITYGNQVMSKVNNGILTLTPTLDTANVGIIHYECSGDGTILLSKYLPTVCSNLTSSSSSSSSSSSGSSTSSSSGSSSGSSSDSSGSDSSSSDTSSSDTLTAQQASEYPEVAAAYDRYNSSKAEVAAYQALAAQYASQAAAAQASGDMNSYNQLVGFEQNALAQASNYQTQMAQAQTQYQQAETIYSQRNNGTLPSDFPSAPS